LKNRKDYSKVEKAKRRIKNPDELSASTFMKRKCTEKSDRWRELEKYD